MWYEYLILWKSVHFHENMENSGSSETMLWFAKIYQKIEENIAGGRIKRWTKMSSSSLGKNQKFSE